MELLKQFKMTRRRSMSYRSSSFSCKTRSERYERLVQDDNDEWSHEAAKIYLQAWVVSWHQLHNEDAKEIALWSYEDLDLLAAKRYAS